MFIDSYYAVTMEQVEYPGSIGDSSAETGRLKHLKILLNEDNNTIQLINFVTEDGFTRHPTAPDGWRETDMTTDQMLPLYLGGDASLKKLIYNNIKTNNWRTGNGDLVSPTFLALLIDSKILLNTSIIAQLLFFQLPYRWNEAHKNLERMEDSSADYLNFIHAALYCNILVKRLISKKTLKQKVRDYYKVEPNSEFLINLYDRVIDKYF